MAIICGDVEGTVDTLSYVFMIPLTPGPLQSLVTERPRPRHLPAVPGGESHLRRTDAVEDEVSAVNPPQLTNAESHRAG